MPHFLGAWKVLHNRQKPFFLLLELGWAEELEVPWGHQLHPFSLGWRLKLNTGGPDP